MRHKIKIGLISVIAIVLFGVLLLYFFVDPSQSQFFPKCPVYSTTGIFCPGCGSQRAIHNILHGNILAAFRQNVLIALLFLVLAYDLIIYLTRKLFKKQYPNLLHHPLTTKVVLVTVVLFWILRNINIFPFNQLAP